MINLNQLRAFYYVAKYSSYTIAAEKLFISQPAVTAQVKLFETYYDIKLFRRVGRNVILTQPAEMIFKKAEKIFELENHLEKILDDIIELKQGTLEIGCTKAYARHIMPSVISVFHRAYPNIHIVLKEGSSMSMIKSLLNYENEVIVVAQMDVGDANIKFAPFSQEEVVAILPKDHPLTKKRYLEFKDIAREPLIIKGKGSGTRKKIFEIFEEQRLEPNIFMESNNTDFIIDLVERGEGISFLVKPSVDQKVKENRIAYRYIKNTNIYLDVSFGYLKNTPLSPAANAFYKIVKKSFFEESPKGGVGSLMARILAEHPQNE